MHLTQHAFFIVWFVIAIYHTITLFRFFTHHQSLKNDKNVESRRLTISSSLSIIGYSICIYSICVVLVIIIWFDVIDVSQEIMTLYSYFAMQVGNSGAIIMYLFYLLRLETVFKGSCVELHKKTFIFVLCLIVISYVLFHIGFVIDVILLFKHKSYLVSAKDDNDDNDESEAISPTPIERIVSLSYGVSVMLRVVILAIISGLFSKKLLYLSNMTASANYEMSMTTSVTSVRSVRSVSSVNGNGNGSGNANGTAAGTNVPVVNSTNVNFVPDIDSKIMIFTATKQTVLIFWSVFWIIIVIVSLMNGIRINNLNLFITIVMTSFSVQCICIWLSFVWAQSEYKFLCKYCHCAMSNLCYRVADKIQNIHNQNGNNDDDNNNNNNNNHNGTNNNNCNNNNNNNNSKDNSKTDNKINHNKNNTMTMTNSLTSVSPSLNTDSCDNDINLDNYKI